jgi:hypothetical protein
MFKPIVIIAAMVVSATSAHARLSCETIDAAISANEDFAEMIMTGAPPAEILDASTHIQSALSAIANGIPKADVARSAVLAKQVQDLIAADQPIAAGLAAVENYRVLVTTFKSRLPTTTPAAMLDYAGFKLRLQAGATSVNWLAIATTITEAQGNWNNVKPQLKDKAVSDLGENILVSLAAASTAQNHSWMDSSAQILLDSVDLIERQVKNPVKGACQ